MKGHIDTLRRRETVRNKQTEMNRTRCTSTRRTKRKTCIKTMSSKATIAATTTACLLAMSGIADGVPASSASYNNDYISPANVNPVAATTDRLKQRYEMRKEALAATEHGQRALAHASKNGVEQQMLLTRNNRQPLQQRTSKHRSDRGSKIQSSNERKPQRRVASSSSESSRNQKQQQPQQPLHHHQRLEPEKGGWWDQVTNTADQRQSNVKTEGEATIMSSLPGRELVQDYQCMETQSMSAEQIVPNILRDPTNQIQFRNIHSHGGSPEMPCFKVFNNGHAMGTVNANDTKPEAIMRDQYLLPDEGLIMSTGNPDDFCENDSDSMTYQHGDMDGDSDLTMIVNATNPMAQTYDACVIEFEFACNQQTSVNPYEVNFEYVWGSEEYYEYVNSEFNDAFAFFLNGDNIALLPDGVTEVTINNVNFDENTDYFYGNDVSTARGVMYPMKALF